MTGGSSPVSMAPSVLLVMQLVEHHQSRLYSFCSMSTEPLTPLKPLRSLRLLQEGIDLRSELLARMVRQFDTSALIVYNNLKFGRILPVMVGAPLGLGRAP